MPKTRDATSVAYFHADANRLADQERRVRAGARPVLLRAAVVDFGDVEVAVLVDAHAVHAPHAAGEITPRAPGILEVAV